MSGILFFIFASCHPLTPVYLSIQAFLKHIKTFETAHSMGVVYLYPNIQKAIVYYGKRPAPLRPVYQYPNIQEAHMYTIRSLKSHLWDPTPMYRPISCKSVICQYVTSETCLSVSKYYSILCLFYLFFFNLFFFLISRHRGWHYTGTLHHDTWQDKSTIPGLQFSFNLNTSVVH